MGRVLPSEHVTLVSGANMYRLLVPEHGYDAMPMECP